MNGSNLPEAWVSSMRLLAGTVTVTGEPPPAGVSDNADTDTSKAITLSARASPKRSWAEFAPAGVGGGPAVAGEDPPPQPPARASIVTNMEAKTKLAPGRNECL